MGIDTLISVIAALGAMGISQIIIKLIDVKERKRNRFDELSKKMDGLSERMDALQGKVDLNRAIEARVRILRFADEVAGKQRHSQESFNQTLEEIDAYEKYCRDHPQFENNKAVLAAQRVKDAYGHCLAERDFLC